MAEATPFQSGASCSAKATALDPKDGIRIFVFHDEAKLHLQLLRTARERKNFFRFLGQLFQLRAQAV